MPRGQELISSRESAIEVGFNVNALKTQSVQRGSRKTRDNFERIRVEMMCDARAHW